MRSTIIILCICAVRTQDHKAQIIYYENEPYSTEGDNVLYNFKFKTSNAIERSENGLFSKLAPAEVNGFYSYVAPNGQEYKVFYTAGENGFKLLPSDSQQHTSKLSKLDINTQIPIAIPMARPTPIPPYVIKSMVGENESKTIEYK